MRRRMWVAVAALALVAGACGSSKKATSGAATTAGAGTTAGAATTAKPADTTAAPSGGATTAKAAGTTAAPVGAATADSTAGTKCGLGDGKKATGNPVKIGAVSTMIPGIDFKDGPNSQTAYFNCVNDNGGVHGRPIQLINLNDELDAGKAGAAATKLIESEKIVAMAGGFSIIDCPVNSKLYAEKKFNVIVAGVPAECFGLPNVAATNMGPHYSAQGAAQAVIADGAKGKLVHVTGNAPGSDYNGSSVKTLALAAGLQFEDVQIPTPITDANTLVLDLVKKAGKGGGVVITFTPPEGLAIMKAAEDQGVIDDVVWGSATPLNDASVAKALSAKWNGKMRINAELALLDSKGTDMTLYRDVIAKYAKDTPLGSFGQMGFLIGRLVVDTLNKMDAKDIDDPLKVNEAIAKIVNFKTDILCKPWYFGENAKYHVPNSWDRTVVPKDGKMEQKDDCFEIKAADDVLTYVRDLESKQNLNKG